MTRGSIREYIEAVKQRYLRASKTVKRVILNEFVQVTGYNRKSVIRAIRSRRDPSEGKRRGRPKRYSAQATAMLVVLWEAANRICSRRLRPFIPELLEVLKQHEEIQVEPGITAQLQQMSASTIDRSALRTPLRSGCTPIGREARGAP